MTKDDPKVDPGSQPNSGPEFDSDFAYRDVNERLPNEALREELDSMTDAEREAFLKRLEDLARTYIGPGGP